MHTFYTYISRLLIIRSAQSKFAALMPFKSTSSPLTHSALVDIIVKPTNTDLARFVGSLLPSAVRADSGAALHRGLIAFHAGVLMEYVKKSFAKSSGATLDEGSIAWVLQSAMDPLQACSAMELKGSGLALVTETIVGDVCAYRSRRADSFLALVLSSPLSTVAHMFAHFRCIIIGFESSGVMFTSCLLNTGT